MDWDILHCDHSREEIVEAFLVMKCTYSRNIHCFNFDDHINGPIRENKTPTASNN